MSNLTYRLLGMTAMLVAFYVAARFLVPMVREPGFGRAAWHTPVVGAVLLGSPIAGLLLFELVSGRALGFGFSVIRKTEEPRAYWGWIAFHFSFFLIVAAATGAYFSTR